MQLYHKVAALFMTQLHKLTIKFPAIIIPTTFDVIHTMEIRISV